MKRQFFTREQVATIIDTLMQHPEVVADAIYSEDPQCDGEEMLELAEEHADPAIWVVPERSNYDKFSSTKHNSICLQRAADDEPIFVLRAKDPTAPEIVEEWCAKNNDLQPIEKVGGAMLLADKMRDWRIANITTAG